MGKTLTKGNLQPIFIEIGGGQRAFSEFAASYLSSNKNNPHANVAHFGVVHSDPLHNTYRTTCRAL